jgi:hypothetical protein
MKLYEHILDGSIHIQRNFFEKSLYDKMCKEIPKLKYIPGYQPGSMYFGNRFQAWPVNEYTWNKYRKIIIDKLEKILGCRIQLSQDAIKMRKMITSEILKSKTNTKYALIHHDHSEFAAVMPFYQSVSGGTAFFEYDVDKYPDIEIGAYPNRLIIYHGKRLHASCQDFTFKNTYKLNIFFNKA